MRHYNTQQALTYPWKRRGRIMNDVPGDILWEIARYLTTLTDRLHFSMISSQTYAQVIASVYASVELEGAEQCRNTLSMLRDTPALARHVQKLVLRSAGGHRPLTSAFTHCWETARVVSALVGAAARYMDALSHFEWDGEDALPEDNMWFQLRKWCPNLTHIGTTFGGFLPTPHSHLFMFSGLTGFSLTFKSGFYAYQLHVPSRESNPVFSRLWDMLTIHCPNLQTLKIVGTSIEHEPTDASRLAVARWPLLQSLTLGDVVFSLHPAVSTPFLDFLKRHTALESLNLPNQLTVPPLELEFLDPKALPNLKHFSGSLEQLRALASRGTLQQNGNVNPHNFHQTVFSPSLSATLQSVCFPDPMQLREVTPLAVSGVLGGMHALTSLTISFSLQSGYDSNGIFRTIVSACPQLLHLDLTCARKPSFYLDVFSRTLRGLSRLRTLSLSVVKVSGDEPMHAGAARIALSNPRLTNFTISYLPANAPSSGAHRRPRPIEHGRYELICDPHGIPVSLVVCEWWEGRWGAGALLNKSQRTKRWVHELRPSGHPDIAKKGWSELLVDKGPAGQETRALVFCLFLTGLTLWGVWKALDWKALSTDLWAVRV